MRRSTVYNNLQNFKAAAEDLRKVLQIDPKNAIAKVSINTYFESRSINM